MSIYAFKPAFGEAHLQLKKSLDLFRSPLTQNSSIEEKTTHIRMLSHQNTLAVEDHWVDLQYIFVAMIQVNKPMENISNIIR